MQDTSLFFNLPNVNGQINVLQIIRHFPGWCIKTFKRKIITQQGIR